MYVEDEYCCGNCRSHEETNSDWQIYCKIYKTYYDRKNTCKYHERIQRAEDGTPCYITTMVCNILGFDDKCSTLEVLRSFRTDVMQKSSKYKETLYEYDTVGPKIAKCIQNDPNNKEISQGFYNAYLDPTARLIVAKKYDQAVEKYKKMTNILKKYYGIEDEKVVPDNYDYTQGGHGYVKKLGEYPTN